MATIFATKARGIDSNASRIPYQRAAKCPRIPSRQSSSAASTASSRRKPSAIGDGVQPNSASPAHTIPVATMPA